MRRKWPILLILSALWIGKTYATQVAASTLSEGKYFTKLSPAVESETAERLKKQLNQIEELKAIRVDSKDSTVHFTIKPNAEVTLLRLRDHIAKAAPNYTYSDFQQEP